MISFNKTFTPFLTFAVLAIFMSTVASARENGPKSGRKVTAAAVKKNTIKTEGILLDSVAFKGGNLRQATVKSLEAAAEAANDLGVAIKKGAKYEFYLLDAPSQKVAAQIIKDSTSQRNIVVSVVGKLSKGLLSVSSLTEKDLTETVEGILIDRENFQAGNTAKVTVDDLQKQSGPTVTYGIALKQNNGSFKYLQFDANGLSQVPEILKSYPSGESVKVTVVGFTEGESYNVVSLLAKLDERKYEGILVDSKDFTDSKGNPASITKADLQDPDKYKTGYGIAVKQPDGKFKFLKLNDDSQISATGVIEATKKNSNIIVAAEGAWTGSLLLASSLEEIKE
ncbi:MAG: hypothetical protein WA003_03370 [Desulfuromonadaceae bacterium]